LQLILTKKLVSFSRLMSITKIANKIQGFTVNIGWFITFIILQNLSHDVLSLAAMKAELLKETKL